MVLTERQENIIRNLTDEQKSVINDYHSNEMRKLKKICKPIIYGKNVPGMHHDDLYVVASNTLLESLESYDNSKGVSFETYLKGNIKRAFYDWTRDSWRGKRCNVERDEKGRIKKDENENPIIITDVSLDSPTDEGIDLAEKIDSGFRIENELSKEVGFLFDEKIEKYIKELPVKVQKVALLICQAYEKSDIMRILNIEEKQYLDAIKTMRLSEYTSILF